VRRRPGRVAGGVLAAAVLSAPVLSVSVTTAGPAGALPATADRAGALRTAAPAPPPAGNPLRVASVTGGVALAPGGARAYVLGTRTVATSSAELVVVDTASLSVVATVPLPAPAPAPHLGQVLVDATGRRAYVLGVGNDFNGSTGRVWVVDLTTNRVVGSYRSDASSMALDPDGQRLWTLQGPTSDQATGTLRTVVAATGQEVGAAVPVGRSPDEVVLTPDGSTLYVADGGQAAGVRGTVTAVDAATRRATATAYTAPDFLEGDLVVDPTGSRVLVGDDRDDSVVTIDTATDRVVGPRRYVLGATFLAFDGFGHLYTLSGSRHQVLDGASLEPVTPPLPGVPNTSGFAVDPAGTRLLLLDAADDPRGTGGVGQDLAALDPRQWVTGSTLPTRIEVGGPSTTVRFTVGLQRPAAAGTVSLVTRFTGRVVASTPVTATGDGRLAGAVTFTSADLTGWGPQRWAVSGGSASTASTVSLLPTDMRARSLLGLAVTRRLDRLSVVGAAKAYDSVSDSYVAWPGRRVSLQRWTSAGWATVAQTGTDRAGHLALDLRVPFTATLRLVDADTPTIWGATSAPVTR